MKNYYLNTLLLLFVLFAISCSDDEDLTKVMECSGEALHTIDNAQGAMIYLSCYDAWGVLLDDALLDEDRTIGASKDIEEEYKVEGLRVQIDACFYEFDLPLLFPDPAFWGFLYNMENIEMIEQE